MILFLVLLILAMLAVGLYATENTGTHDVTLWNYHWSGVPDWVPVVVAAGVVVVLFLVYLAYAGTRWGMRHGALRRRITTHEAAIGDLRKENQRLREENARLKSQMQGLGTAPAAHQADQSAGEPPSPGEAPPRPREAPAYHPQPSLGERVRAFLSGRQPAGY
jgi:hypothetical protein